MREKWRKFSIEEIKQVVASSKSTREVAIKLGYSGDGGSSIATIKAMILELGLDTSHFLGQGINKNNFDYSRFQKGKVIKPSNALDALCYLRGRKCENCGLESWLDVPIPLEIHHIDGNHTNNELDNLQVLCCNCHALTTNYKGKNYCHKQEKVSDEKFIEALKTTPNVRQAILKLNMCASGANYARAYDLIYKNNIVQITNNK